MKPVIGENIKKLRGEKQVTQEQLAEHLNISYQAVSKWENNVTTPDIFLLPAIAEYFEVTIDELFKFDMRGYKNKAARLMALYNHRNTKENFDKAEEEYEKLVAENKADDEDMRCYGILYHFRSNDLIKKAEEILKKAVEMGNERAEAQLAAILIEHGRQKESIEKYEEAVKNNPDNVHYWRLLIFSYGGPYGDGVNPEKALEINKQALEKFPNEASLLSTYADICRGLKRFDEAVEYYKRSIEQNPDLGGSYYGMAFLYSDMKKYKEAIWAWEEVIALHGRLGMSDEEIEMGTEWPRKEIAKLRALLDQQ